MDLDNPSYFSVPTDEPDCSTQLRRKNRMTNSESSSEASLTRQLTPPRYGNNRREARNFLRSVSTNSADSNQELLIMGEPRLSDMAPDLAFKHPSRSNSLKRCQENTQHFPLPTSEEEEIADLPEDEVFLMEDSARYSNFSAIKRIANDNNSPKGTNSPRRHSISAFSARDRTNSVASSARSFKDDFSTMMQESVASTSAIDEHSLRHMSYPRKRCLKCSKVDDCKTRWKSLKDVYWKKKKEIQSGTGSAAQTVIRWEHMEALAFLDGIKRCRKTASNIEGQEDDTESRTEGNDIMSQTENNEIQHKSDTQLTELTQYTIEDNRGQVSAETNVSVNSTDFCSSRKKEKNQ